MNVLVVGAGFMGAGIAQVCAQAGCTVALVDVDRVVTDRALRDIRWSVEKLASKGAIAEPAAAVLERIRAVADLRPAAAADWMIEAVWEEEALKRDVFVRLDKAAGAQTVIATNTSSIPISRLAAVTARPERVIGLHFFGPVPLMRLVEVVRGDKTSDDVYARGMAFVQALGKVPVRVQKDIPGFVMNRIFAAALREAVELVEQGVVTPEDVDTGMRLGYGWNAGPFEIADNAGLDTIVRVDHSIRALGAEHLATTSNLIERMVAQGQLGRKARQGFYEYSADGKTKTVRTRSNRK